MNERSLEEYLAHPACIGAECMGYNVRKTARLLAKAYDDALAPCSLKSTQFSVLVGLHAKGPLGMKELADILKMDRTTLTRNLKPLERRRLVRVQVGNDLRQRAITLTEEGVKLLADAIPLWRRVQRRLVSLLGEGEAAQLLSALHSLDKIAQG
jgi:DNA-binding MarR family transcriptional regulator